MYKILLPVSSPAFLVKERLEDLKGFEEHTIVLNNWTDSDTEIQVKEFAARGAEAYNCTYNLGLAASWNFGMKRMMEDEDDFVIILSASAVFDKSISYFIDAILEHENRQPMGRYICSSKAQLHCFAHTRIGVEVGGYFDENFWPIYYEDTDFIYRAKLNNMVGKMLSSTTDIVHSYALSISCNKNPELMSLHQHNASRWNQYYINKWGGDHNSEIFSTPFNNPSTHINSWKIQEPFYHPNFQRPWNPPPPSVRY
jgi:GT2 family glycosyltransferase